MYKLAQLAVAAALGLALAGCGGGQSTSGAPAGGVPAKPSAAAAGTSAKPAAASPSAAAGGAAPSAAVVGHKGPGPYSAKGSVPVANGQASIDATDTLQWQPNTVLAKAGDKVTLAVKNTGNTAHTFVSPGLSVSQEDV